MAGRVGSSQAFCLQSLVGSGRVRVLLDRVGSGPRKVTRGQLWKIINEKIALFEIVVKFIYRCK